MEDRFLPELDQGNEDSENEIDFHMKGCALGLALKQRQKELGNGLLDSRHHGGYAELLHFRELAVWHEN